MTEQRVRGEPLWALGTVLAIWIGLRLAFWGPDGAAASQWARASGFTMVSDGAWDRPRDAETLRLMQATAVVMAQQALWSAGMESAGAPAVAMRPVPTSVARVRRGVLAGPGRLETVMLAAAPVARGGTVGSGVTAAVAPGGVGVLAAAVPARGALRRWSGDGWVMARPGGIGFDHGAILPAYGASQAGAVLRWRINPGSARPVDLYARGSVALVTAPFARGRESDVAVGVIAQPFAAVPVKIAVEARDSRFDDGSTHWRPAVMAVSAVPPLALPLGLRGDVYAAAGYVGGAAATGFVDGQARVDHAVARFGGFALRAGGGVWGGAQQGAGRLDVGPSASLGFRVGASAARLQVDWRAKVAGDASPGSGPVVTLAAGF